MSILVERATANDIHLLSVLGTTTFYEAYYEQDAPIDIADYISEAFSPDVITKEIDDPAVEYFIAFTEEKAVGYINLLIGSEAEGIEPDRSLELKRIYTVERVWGSGVGDHLLTFACERANELGFKWIWLGVWEENIRAQRFYSKHDFTQVGTIRFPYGDSFGINKVLRKEV
jgi:ribosomal protein S18 acetylase RimI-like enzyme